MRRRRPLVAILPLAGIGRSEALRGRQVSVVLVVRMMLRRMPTVRAGIIMMVRQGRQSRWPCVAVRTITILRRVVLAVGTLMRRMAVCVIVGWMRKRLVGLLRRTLLGIVRAAATVSGVDGRRRVFLIPLLLVIRRAIVMRWMLLVLMATVVAMMWRWGLVIMGMRRGAMSM